MAGLRAKLKTPSGLDDQITTSIMIQLFWISNAQGDLAAAQCHLVALADRLWAVGLPIRSMPGPVPGRFFQSDSWHIDRAKDILIIPPFMVPQTGPLSRYRPDYCSDVPGLDRLHDDGLIFTVLLTTARCITFNTKLFTSSKELLKTLALDFMKYILINAWIWGTFEPSTPFEAVVFMAISKSSIPVTLSLDGVCVLSGQRRWQELSQQEWRQLDEDELLRKVRQVIGPIDQPGVPQTDLYDHLLTKHSLFVAWMSLVLGSHMKKKVGRQWCAKLLQSSLAQCTPSLESVKDFESVAEILKASFPWAPRFTGEAMVFWDYACTVT